MRIFFHSFTLLFFSFSFSQEIKIIGRCVDKTGDPIEFVAVFCSKASTPKVYSNEKGFFEISVPKEESVEISFKSNEFEEKRTLISPTKNTTLETIRFNYSQIKSVTVTAEKSDPFLIPKLAPIDLQSIPMGSVERSLVYTTAATSNNELTSNYNVRG